MRCTHFIASLILYPLCIFVSTYSYSTLVFNKKLSSDNNTIRRYLNSDKELAVQKLNPSERSMDYPTQVIRMSSKTLEDLEITCAEVNRRIDQMIINKITKDKFFYSTIISCTYDPDTRLATEFTLYSYFDPLSDDAITYLQTYLEKYNGSNFLGSQLLIEPAKALIVSLNLSAGLKKNPNTPPFIVYRQDRSNFYFKNNYELQASLITDTKKRFFSNEPDQILPFLDKWLFHHAGSLYKAVLRDSNYALLQPERIFLMEHGEPLFVSPIKNDYVHNCTQYEHHNCLK